MIFCRNRKYSLCVCVFVRQRKWTPTAHLHCTICIYNTHIQYMMAWRTHLGWSFARCLPLRLCLCISATSSSSRSRWLLKLLSSGKFVVQKFGLPNKHIRWCAASRQNSLASNLRWEWGAQISGHAKWWRSRRADHHHRFITDSKWTLVCIHLSILHTILRALSNHHLPLSVAT